MRISLRHLRTIPIDGRKAGYCLEGAKLVCERYGIDWADAKRNGIDEAVLLATGDAQAHALVAHARSLDHA
jgi:hypothetical protein